MAVELKVEDKIDYKRLKAVAKGSRTILVGHEGEKAEIAKSHHFGFHAMPYPSKHGNGMMPGRDVPPRPYLEDGFLHDETGVKRYYESLFVGRGHLTAQALGKKIAVDIVDFVQSDPYSDKLPNAEAVIADKGSAIPLIDTHSLMDSVTSKVVKDE